MNYITVKDKKITGHYSGDPAGIPKNRGEIIEVPGQNDIVVDYYVDEYNQENWKLRPLKDRIVDGSAKWVPEDMTCMDDSNELRFKTRVEMIRDGLDQLEPNEKIVGDEIVEKTLEEKLADGLLTQEEYDQIEQKEENDRVSQEIQSGLNNVLIQWAENPTSDLRQKILDLITEAEKSHVEEK